MRSWFSLGLIIILGHAMHGPGFSEKQLGQENKHAQNLGESHGYVISRIPMIVMSTNE
jgi:hypothetical protein